MKKAIVLIADMLASRDLKNRAAVQHQLAALLEVINHNSRSALLSPLTITLGDEFQGVFTSASGIYATVFSIASAMHPARFRFSVAAGTIVTKINPHYAIGMDGPAFYTAREGIQQLKAEGGMLSTGGLQDELQEAARHITALLNACTHNWSKIQLTIMSGLLQGNKTAAIATYAGISPQAVYKHISTHHMHTITAAIACLENLLNNAVPEKITYTKEKHERHLRVADQH